MPVRIISSTFASEIYVLLDAVVSGQILLRKQSRAKCASALLPLITRKLCVVASHDAAVEDGNADSVACTSRRDSTADLAVNISRQELARAGCYFDVAGIVREGSIRRVERAHFLIGRDP